MSWIISPGGDVKRLAKWAQKYIDALLRRVTFLEKRVKELSSEHPGSNVVMAGRIGEPDVTLPPDSQIYFYVGSIRDRLVNMVEVRLDHQNPNRIYIGSYGSRGVRIVPSSSNSFYLELESR